MIYFLLFLAFSIGVFSAFWIWIAYNSKFHGNWVKAPLVIFDFDGTICPSYPLFIEQMNLLVRKIDADFQNMAPKEIMSALSVSAFKLPFLLRKARKNVQRKLLELEPVPGMADVLNELKNRGFSLGVLTSNSLENVLPYLKKHRIDLFDFIYTGNNVFGKEKHLKLILKKSGLSNAIYVGDEGRDIEAAKRASIQSIGVAWGYNSSSFLQKYAPDSMAYTPSTLLNILAISILR